MGKPTGYTSFLGLIGMNIGYSNDWTIFN